MSERKLSMIEYISIIAGVMGLVFAVYQAKDTALQIGFIIAAILSGMVYFIYNNLILSKRNHKDMCILSRILRR